MKCKICGSTDIKKIYFGPIRNGGLGRYTSESIEIYQCTDCMAIWHELVNDLEEYYETTNYRDELENTSEEQDFYNLHDRENLNKLFYSGGTELYRNAVIADVGCGCGAFLDYVRGGAKDIIAVEPSVKYRDVLSRKGFHTYPYAKEAICDYKDKCDVVTSFDVIEHVEDPISFVADYYDLLKEDGVGIIGTPTDAPIMRKLLGEVYEKQILYSVQHLWILGEKNLRIIAEQAGFKKISFKYFQRYGIDNFIAWIKDKKPNSGTGLKLFSGMMDMVWKSELESTALSDYIVMYLYK